MQLKQTARLAAIITLAPCLLAGLHLIQSVYSYSTVRNGVLCCVEKNAVMHPENNPRCPGR